MVNYERQIKNHSFKLLAGTSVEQSNNKGLEGYRNSFPNNYLYELGAGDKSTASNNSSLTEYALLSYFGRLNYAFNDRYLLEANVRYDGSSRFAKDHRWGFFPSVSAGWRISEESFWKNSSIANSFDNLISALRMVCWVTRTSESIPTNRPIRWATTIRWAARCSRVPTLPATTIRTSHGRRRPSPTSALTSASGTGC